MKNLTDKCILCPRKCNVDRNKQLGFCGAGEKAKIAKFCLFKFEEPCLTGENGNGAVFFSNCNLKCKFCQNIDISQNGEGKEITDNELANIFKSLEKQGASHINLITPTHYVQNIISALNIYRPNIPIIYNSSGYESVKTLQMLEKFVDIYLVDIKFFNSKTSRELAGAGDYFEVTKKACEEMVKQKPLLFDENGLLKQGVIIRHLVMPLLSNESLEILKFVKENFDNKVIVSLMSQFTPLVKQYGKLAFLNRKITKREYNLVRDYFLNNFSNGYIQDFSSSNEKYIPSWN